MAYCECARNKLPRPLDTSKGALCVSRAVGRGGRGGCCMTHLHVSTFAYLGVPKAAARIENSGLRFCFKLSLCLSAAACAETGKREETEGRGARLWDGTIASPLSCDRIAISTESFDRYIQVTVAVVIRAAI